MIVEQLLLMTTGVNMPMIPAQQHFPRMLSPRRVSRSALAAHAALVAARGLALAVRYHKHGPANEVYRVENVESDKTPLKPSEIAVKFLAAPVNPADINVAEGVYGKQPPLPAIGGNEGVAVVTTVGSQVSRVKVGDWVLPAQAAFGTWRQEARGEEKHFVRVRNDIPAAFAATISVNMATALRLLSDFGNLQRGDWIVQNGANSMVGLAVVQLARERGIHTINIIRSDRPDAETSLRLLTELGGDINIPDVHLPTHSMSEVLSELPALKLGLNCVGGAVATDMVRALGPSATLVTYGGMSKQPLTLPAEVVAAKNISLEGFWMTKWYEANSLETREAMVAELADLVKAKKLSFFYEVHDMDDFQYALSKSVEPFRFRKVVLDLDFPDRLAEHDARPASDYDRFQGPQF